jgi:hypothetical protein
VSGSLYFFALAAALSLCVIGGQIVMSARRCRHCQYEIE